MLETLLQPDDVEERCGFILNDRLIVHVKNVAEDKSAGYEMDPTEALEYLDEATATWHTHPDTDPNLSGEDYSGFLSWPDMEHVIIGRRAGKVVVARYKIENGLVIACD